MAQWVTRKRADGGDSVQIKWRQDGRWQSEPFTNLRLAGDFRAAVENAGHRRPEGWVKGAGWYDASTTRPQAEDDVPPPVAMSEVARSYFAEQDKRIRRGRVKPYTVHRARRTYALHLEEFFGHLPFIGIEDTTVDDWIEGQLDIEAAPRVVLRSFRVVFARGIRVA